MEHLDTILQAGPTARITSVTPAMAERWLGKNGRNRNVRQPLVDRYAADMVAGAWRFTGEAVKFSPSGRLLDGQHRLRAVVQSGATVEILVISGVEDDAQDVMDTGAKRTGADMLSMREIKNASTVAAVARMIAIGLDSTESVSHSRILTVVESDPALLAICGEILPTLNIRRVPPAVLGYAYWRLQRINEDDADRFFRSWSTMANLPEGSPILALVKRVNANDDSTRIKGVGVRKELLAAIFLAWNAWRKGGSRMIIKIPRRADGSMSFPQPI